MNKTKAKSPVSRHLGIEEYRFSNGLRAVLFRDDSRPTFTLNLTVLAGSVHEGPGESGTAHVFEHLLFRGVKGYPDVKQTLTDLGAEYNGNTHFERTCFFETLTAGDGNLAAVIKLEAARLGRALLREADVEKERKIVEQEFQLRESSPMTAMNRGLLGATFSYHPYARDPIGTLEDFKALRIPTIQAFYERFYTPDNAVLFIAGNFDTAKAISLIERHFGKLPRSRRRPDVSFTKEPPFCGERRFSVRGVGDARYLLTSYLAPGASCRGSTVANVLSHMLASDGVGVLHDRLVTKGLATTVAALPFMGKMPMPFMVYAMVAKDKDPGAAEAAICEVLENTRFTQDALDRAKSTVEQAFDAMWRTPTLMATLLPEFEASGSWKLALVRREETKGVTLQDVQDFAAKYFRIENRVVGTFIPDPKAKPVEIEPERGFEESVKLLEAVQPDVQQATKFTYTPAALQKALEWFDVGPARIGHLRKEVSGDDVIFMLKMPFADSALVAPKALEGGLLAGLFAARTRSLSKEAVKGMLAGKMCGISVTPLPCRTGAVVGIMAKKPTLMELAPLFWEMVRMPFIDEELLRDEIYHLEGQLKAIHDNPMQVCAEETNRMTFPPGHPRRFTTVLEKLEILGRITVADLMDFHRNFYGPIGMKGAVVGDLSKEEISEFLGGLVAPGWAAAQPFKVQRSSGVDQLYRTSAKVAMPGKPVVLNALIQPMRFSQADPEFAALTVATAALFGDPLSSRIAKKVRGEEALCYAVNGDIHAELNGDFAICNIMAVSSPDNHRKALDLIRSELEAAAAGNFTEAEVKTFRDAWVAKLAVMRADDQMVASGILDLNEAGMDFSLWAQYDERLAALTAAQVNEAFREHFDCSKMGLLQIGDLSFLEPAT